MATKQNTSAKRTPKTKNVASTPMDRKIKQIKELEKKIAAKRVLLKNIRHKKFDDRMAKLRNLFGWGLSDAQTDLSRACYGDLTGQFEDLIATAMAALKEAPMYELMVEDFAQLGGDFNLLTLCARMYLAGKCSPARIDMAVFDTANPPLIPDKL